MSGTAGTGIAFGLAVLFSFGAAFLVGAETALGRVLRLGAETSDRDGPAVRRLDRIVADPARHLNTALLLRVCCEVLAVLALAVGFFGLLGLNRLATVLTAGVMILVSYVLIGVVPRVLARRFPTPVALAGATVVHPVTPVLGPLAQLLVSAGQALVPSAGTDREGPFSTEEELRHLVDLAERGQVIDAEERQMIHSVFQLDDTTVREVMIPRTDIVFLDGDVSVEDALEKALSSGYSRIPVIGESLDDVIGVVYLKDIVARLHDVWATEGSGAPDPGRTVRDIMREPTYVPDSQPVDELLREMQQQRIHLAVVIDEYGGTAGIVTIEDIVEEIVGEITDEYDDEVPPIERLGDNRARVTARLPVGELAELFDVEIDAPDVDTVGGLLAYALGRVPQPGSRAEYAGLRLVSEDPARRRRKIATVLVERLPEPAESADANHT
ncbi:HlyC/CorC family transporter [Thermobifida halotolerans]|uniref:HlyC/CorC family transporter n=1 Tax=Thermobifida halotolerans TaxID=483545 RepID=A0A399G5E8_9ACTN|nr:hemolysin family protein [Thermobifida halotolerans]UOE19937.1 HlyC/CorC family transporter [Thermobifida halotolerans]